MNEESDLVAKAIEKDINTLVEDLNIVIEAHNVLVEENKQLKQALLDIKEHIGKYKFAYVNPLTQNIYNVAKCDDILDIVNKALNN